MGFAADPSPTLHDRRLSLEGEWRLLFGGPEPEVDLPLPNLQFTESLHLPATTETAQKGPLNAERLKDGLTAVRKIEAPVWYQREFQVPASWVGSQLSLFIERSKWSAAWLDGQPLGVAPLLCTPQKRALGCLAPGKHVLTLCVDNRRKPAPGDNHQVSVHTQGNWNGLLGKLEIHRTDATWIDELRLRPDLAARRFSLTLQLGGRNPSRPALLMLEAESFNHAGRPHRTSLLAEVPAGATSHQLHLPLGEQARTWDEFDPALYRLRLRLECEGSVDERVIVSGLRDFSRAGTRLLVNGRATFLRGEVNCCVFPLTGHPPMQKEGWLDYYRILLAHGLNHVRFHSWTPPEAAFAAADELGLYVLTELPFWGKWDAAARQGLEPEGRALLEHFGHHPSLVMLSLGNEHQGEREVMRALVAALRGQEPGLLIAQGANNYLETPSLAPEDDFWISARLPQADAPKGLANIRGSFSTNDVDNGHLQVGPGGTCHDYRASLKRIPLPVISHEIGQFTTLPDFREISRYTGVFEARNLAIFEEKARQGGLLPISRAAFEASGRLAALLYREEMEAALRTPGMAGFELLGLQDFPGQGTALVGLLNAFMEPKGSMSATEFRRSCAAEVLLARFARHTWSDGERFHASIELANYGPEPLVAGQLHWSLHDLACQQTLASSTIPATASAQGALSTLCPLDIELPSLPEATHLELRLDLVSGARQVHNAYPLWLYPAQAQSVDLNGNTPLILRAAGPALAQALAAGETVLLMPDAQHAPSGSPGGAFTTDFWCWPMFKNKPGTMGLLIQAGHPALASFPSATHSDWQWFHLAKAARPLPVGQLPGNTEPIVRVLDNLERCHSYALLLEARVGPGRLLVCAVDLPSLAPTHPEARQLLQSLLNYLRSPAFPPRQTLSPETLGQLFSP